jgi:hypothetical protein
MEFASEMVVKATLHNLAIAEVPTTLVPDGRSRPPHLRSWRDGWRHLKFLLTFAPNWLFFYPGAALLLAGLAGLVMLVPGAQRVAGVQFDVHTMLFAAGAILMGLQLMTFAIVARVFGVREGYWPSGPALEKAQRLLTVDRGCLTGGALISAGVTMAAIALASWAGRHYGDMNPAELMRLTIPSVLLACSGLQIMFTSFLLCLLQQPAKRS